MIGRAAAALGGAAVCVACVGTRARPVAPVASPDLAARPAAEAKPGGAASGWLRVEGTRILLPDGRPFRGRGANVHDTRACDACAWEPPHVEETLRRIDELVDGWGANFVRLLLESYPDDGHALGLGPPQNGGKRRVHYRNVLDDESYFADVLRIVRHIGQKPGVYVLLSLWKDPTLDPLGWPTERTQRVWQKLARALRDEPFVLFGVSNEPRGNEEGRLDGLVWQAMNDVVAAIRSVEAEGQRHVVAVQGTREWGRVLDYYVEHPITAGGGANVVYETHPYDRAVRFDALVAQPATKLPVLIGEFGAAQNADITMYPEDCVALMDLAERLEIPWIAWTFHTNCPPELLVVRRGTCAVGAPLVPSPWGQLVKDRLAQPWRASERAGEPPMR